MSTTENAVSTVSLNPYTEGAQALLQEFRQARERIPRFIIPERKRDTSRLNAAASVPPEFVELTATAVGIEKALVRGDGVTPAEIRDYVGYADAYSPLADELEALAQFVRHSVTAARNEAGVEALTIYAMAQRLAKRPRYARLAPFVTDMRRALGRVRKPTPEAAAQKAAERATKAAARVAKRAPKALPAAPAEPAPKVE